MVFCMCIHRGNILSPSAEVDQLLWSRSRIDCMVKFYFEALIISLSYALHVSGHYVNVSHITLLLVSITS